MLRASSRIFSFRRVSPQIIAGRVYVSCSLGLSRKGLAWDMWSSTTGAGLSV